MSGKHELPAKSLVAKRCRQLCLLLGATSTVAEAYSSHCATWSNSQYGRNARPLRREALKSVSSDSETPRDSSLWSSSVIDESRKGASNNDHARLPILPCEYDLDRDGQLPDGAYIMSNPDSDVDQKPTCRLSVAVNLFDGREHNEFDAPEVVSNLHAFLDRGLTSFELLPRSNSIYALAESDIFKRFRKESPAYQIERCRLTVPFVMPKEVTKASVRSEVFQLLRRTGTDDLDCVQLHFQRGSPYHLDVLDHLQDMRRDGFVRSISTARFPLHDLRLAFDCGFQMEANQLMSNLLDPTDYATYAETDPRSLVLSSPLAGGLLTDRYIRGDANRPPLFTRTAEVFHYKHTLSKWKTRYDTYIRARLDKPRDPYAYDDSAELRRLLSMDTWPTFRWALIGIIQEIARKHGVSMASVVLRWTLQLDKVAGTVTACQLVSFDPNAVDMRTRQLREVFTFALDAEDMQQLWQATGFIRLSHSDELLSKY